MRAFMYAWVASLVLAYTAPAFALSRAYEDFVPAGSLRLGQVMAVLGRNDIVKTKPLYKAVTATGMSDTDIVDGAVVVVRIFCCGGITKEYSSEVQNSLFLYVPQSFEVSSGDVVEFRVGHVAEGAGRPVMNSVTGVVQKTGQDAGHCWWDPKNDRLWLRVLYCDWMPARGWVKQGGVNPAWYKPQAPNPPANGPRRPIPARWQKATNVNCLVWNPSPDPDDSVTWTGSCVDGKAEGRGTQTFRFPDRGTWKEERYEGEMQGGKLNGQGTLYYENGDRFEGEFSDGQRARGSLYYANGAKYEGTFANGGFNGPGKFTYADGSYYEGNFANSLPNGKGTLTQIGAPPISGAWTNGCLRNGVHVAAAGVPKERCGFK